MLRDNFSWVTLVQNEQNVGLSRANNQGVAISKGEYISILNPDVVVGSRAFIKLIEVAENLPNFGVVGPKLIDGRGRFLNDSKRNIPSPLTSLRRLLGVKSRYVKSYYAKHVSAIGMGYVDVLSGSFLIMKRKDFIGAGGFDEDYFLFGEDIDLCYKIRRNGLQNYYIGDAVAIHYRAESTGRSATYVKQFYGAMRIFYKKHFRSNQFFDTLISGAIKIVAFMLTLWDYTKEERAVDSVYLISDDTCLYDKLKVVVSANIKKISIESITNLGDQNIEIIFDNNFIGFDAIIHQMQKHSKTGITYKIRPKYCSYIVGSDFNDGKGAVVWF